jgi:uncharacterized membrane protein (UPF0127 family)
MGRKDLSGAFLLLPDCTSVHTCFMRGDIDIVFLDREKRVVRVHDRLRPWRLLFAPSGVQATLELPAGYAGRHRIERGDIIECQPG